MKKTMLVLLYCGLMVMCAISVSFAQYTVTQVTTNSTVDSNPQISNNGDMVWIGRGLYSQEIFVQDGITKAITQLTNNFVFEERPQINDRGDVVWAQWNEAEVDTSIMLYTKAAVNMKITRIDPPDDPLIMDSDSRPRINNNGQVVWRSFDGSYNQIMFYDGVNPAFQVTNNNFNNDAIRLNNNGAITWTTGSPFTGMTDIWLYDSANGARALTNTSNVPEFSPQINDSGNVVWYGWSGSTMSSGNFEIYHYSKATSAISRLTNNSYDDMHPLFNASGQIAWMADISTTDTELFFRDGLGGSNTNISNSPEDDGDFSLNDNGWVVWAKGMGSIDNDDNQIWVYDRTAALKQLTSNVAYDNIEPKINNSSDLIWSGTGGSGTVLTDYEIFKATTRILCIPPAAGFCNDNNACTSDSYNANAPGPGTCPCVNTPVANGTGCDDGQFCTINDSCTSGTCGGALNLCSDAVNCTIDTCNETSNACVHTPNNILCPSDGLYCNGTESCSATLGCVSSGMPCSGGQTCDETKDVCVSPLCTPPVAGFCNDNNACTTDSYNSTAPGPGTCPCVNTPVVNGTSCNDGDPCTVNDVCSNSVCQPGAPKNCDDGNVCTLEACFPSEPGGCKYWQYRPPCDDGNPCTIGDQCSGGVCQPGVLNNCSDGKTCTTDACDTATGACSNAVNCTPPSACNASGICENPACSAPANGCEDSNVCTNNDWNANVLGGICPCVNTPVANGTSCSDGDPCTVNDVCSNSVCQPGAPKNCDDGNICTLEACFPSEPGGCKYWQYRPLCDDGNPCTVGDQCSGGVCQPGAPRNCDDGNICTLEACFPSEPGGCKYWQYKPPCSDGNPCTIGDQCSGGVCQSGVLNNCSDGKTCTTDTCDTATGACSNTVNCVVPQTCNTNGICE